MEKILDKKKEQKYNIGKYLKDLGEKELSQLDGLLERLSNNVVVVWGWRCNFCLFIEMNSRVDIGNRWGEGRNIQIREDICWRKFFIN